MIQNITYTLPQSSPLTSQLLTKYINLFFSKIFSSIYTESKPVHLMLMVKVEFTDDSVGYRTLADLRKVNFNDKDVFTAYLTDRLGILSDTYHVHPIKNIIFSYIVKDGIASGDRLLMQQSEYSVSVHKFNNFLIPLTMIPSEYGEVLVQNIVGDINRVVVKNGGNMFAIDVSTDGLTNNVTISGAKDIKWTDTKLSPAGRDSVFKREIGKSIHYIKNGEIIVSEKLLNAKPFKTINAEKQLTHSNTIMTMDIETNLVDNKQTPYLICGYSEDNYIHSFTKDLSLNSVKSMFKDFITKLIANKNIKIVYAHNLAGFDGILLLKHLINYTGANVEPLIFNGKLISIKFILKSGKSKRTIVFKDSLLFLPMSLRKLCTYFKVDQIKTYFPFLLTDINYSGPVPGFDLWSGITIEDYNSLSAKYQDKVWNFKEEALKYCKIDCKALFDILNIFNNLIFEHFSINIHNSTILTLPALAMRIFKTHFLAPDTIYQLLGKVEADIRQAYTGGAVDVYIPTNGVRFNAWNAVSEEDRSDLYYYDVNSLYPFIMSESAMPIGKPIAFEGNILDIMPDAYGYFYCKITSPAILNEPILQRKIKTSDGIRTIAGLGTWEGWVYSEEMNNAINLGYEFEVIRGYRFTKGHIFFDFVTKMYDLRTEFAKDHPMNLIAKLLMNSLYGKFGMKAQKSVIEMFDTNNDAQKQSVQDIIDSVGESITDYIQLDNHLVLIRNNIANYTYDESKDLYHGLDVNIAIAAAVTAGGRLWMAQFKNNPNYNLYYSDTDSIIIDKPLPEDKIGNNLGQVKLECTIEKAVFLAPKVYGLITKDGKEIIKVKGVTKNVCDSIHFNDLQDLLYKDSRKDLTQRKWFKSIFDGTISVLDVAYQLKVTNNKRMPQYMFYAEPVFSGTVPFNYVDLEVK